MKQVFDIKHPEETLKLLPGVLLASLVTIVFLQWLPLLSFFFSVPIYFMYFSKGKNGFVLTIFLSFILNVLVTYIIVLQISVFTGAMLKNLLASSSFFLLPLLLILIPGEIRLRYKIGLMGIVSALSWSLFFSLTDAGSNLTNEIKSITDNSVNLMYSMVPEGYEREKFMSEFSLESFYTIILNIFLYSILPVFITMYAVGLKFGLAFSERKNRTDKRIIDAKLFYNDFILIAPLLLGMIGVIFGKFFSNRMMTIYSWNITLASGLFFVWQGWGILTFFVGYLKAKTGFNVSFIVFFVFFGFIFIGLQYFLGCLLVAGVVELFIPLRMRFNNKDIIDPTPGRNNDQNQ